MSIATTEPNAKPSTERTRVAVIMGGDSAEAEVSRSSAAEVAKAARSAGLDATCLELDSTLTEQLQRYQPNVVFPALHGPVGEDGTIQGYLEIMGLPYVGSDVRGSALAMDKCIAKSIYESASLPIAKQVIIHPEQSQEALAQRILEQLGERVVIKPRAEGSAIGVMRLSRADELPPALASAALWPRGGLAEPYITGKEVTVGILDLHNQDMRACPAIEVQTAQGEWYDFENRYAQGKSQHVIPAALPTSILEQLQSIALNAHQILGLRDLSRSDFLVDSQNNITLLETNTLPGMTPTSLYPDGAAALGLDFPSLIAALVGSALQRAAH